MSKTRDLIKIFDRSLIGLVVVLFISFVATTIWIQLDPTSSFASARDNYRQQQLELVAASLREFPNATVKNLPPNIQIGKASSGCSISTNYCQVIADSCVMPFLLPKGDDQVLSDVLSGTPDKTGVIFALHEDNYVLRSCYGETRLVEAHLFTVEPGTLDE